MSKKYSLLIGLESVDTSQYAGWNGFLRYAEKDVKAMKKIAIDFDNITTLTGQNATRENVLNELFEISQKAEPGDFVMVYYSGHGGQVKDENGDEISGEDQTWCLYNGQLIDDELWLCWSKFKKDVRILLLSDSCHSGSVARFLEDEDNALSQAIAEGAKHFPMNFIQKTYIDNKLFYQTKGREVPSPLTIEVQASLISISACLDEESAYEDLVVGLSHFTYALLNVWNEGNFSGDYQAFYQAICDGITKPQTPQLNHYGILNPDYVKSKPFASDTITTSGIEKKPNLSTSASDELLVQIKPGSKGIAKSDLILENLTEAKDYRVLSDYNDPDSKEESIKTICRFSSKVKSEINSWDRSYMLLDELTQKGYEVEFIEPNQNYRSPISEEREVPKGEDDPHHIYMSTWPHPEGDQTNQYLWHLGSDYSQLADARDSFMNDPALMVSVHEKPIRIAHLDTGYLDIPLFKPEYLKTDLAQNFVDDEPGAIDRNRIFSPFENPGHGTATLAILAGPKVTSPKGLEGFEGYVGAIPFAEVIPMRVNDSVALFKTNAFVDAVHKAIELKCDVITMSMGGAPSKAWADAVNEAYNRGIVVVSAAGNSFRGINLKHLVVTPEIVHPARFERVIGAAGITYNQQPYLFENNDWPGQDEKTAGGSNMQGNHGPDKQMWHVISAYTPNLMWIATGKEENARFNEPHFIMTGGGTSSATPQIAATAALWIAKYRKELEPISGTWKIVEAVRKALFAGAEKFDASTGTIAIPGEKLGKYFSYLGQGALRAANTLSIKPALGEFSPSPVAKIPNFPLIRTLFRTMKGQPTTLLTREDEIKTEMLSLELSQIMTTDPELIKLAKYDISDPQWLDSLSGAELQSLKLGITNSNFASNTLKAVFGGL